MDLPPFLTFFDTLSANDFWKTVKYFLFYIAPLFMIWFAVELVGWFVRMVRGTVEDGGTDRRRREDDDDYYYD